MSFSFYIPHTRAPSLHAIETAIEGAWVCPDAPEDDPLPEGFACHPFFVGSGARGVELVWEAGRVQVRIMTCSSRGDHELALAIVKYLARDGATVEPEDGEAMSLAELAKAYGEAWIDQQVASGTRYPLAMAAEGQTVTLGGPRREFHLGPRFHAKLASDTGGTIDERLLQAMIDLQALDGEAYYAAKTMQVSNGGEAFTVAVWAPEVSYLFPPVERFAIICDDGSTFMIPSDKGPEVAGVAWQWVDEKHAIVEALAGYPWTCAVDVARKHAIAGTER